LNGSHSDGIQRLLDRLRSMSWFVICAQTGQMSWFEVPSG
jgi:hypothetical protein